MDVLSIIENIKLEISNISTVKDSKAKNNLELNIKLLEEKWTQEKISLQNEIVCLQSKLIDKLETKMENISDCGKKTYASCLKVIPVIPESKFSLIIKGEDADMTSDAIKEQIIKKIKIANLGIAVNGIRKASQNKLIISCPSKLHAEKLTEEINKTLKKNMVAEELRKKNPKIFIRNLQVDLTEEEIIEALKTQNDGIKDIMNKDTKNTIKLIKMFKPKNQNGLTNYILETSGALRSYLMEKEKINIGFSRVRVEDANPLTQCYHCLKFGHTALKCLNKDKNATCLHCAKDHEWKDCPNKNSEEKCSNCVHQNTIFKMTLNTNHKANDTNCTYFKKMMYIAQSRIDYD